jgi:4-amino-4-deoxy-L-arabinose transferase-like glycosyltransferase
MLLEPASRRLLARSRRLISSLCALLDEPTRLILLIALFQIVIWGCLSGFLAVAPPSDSLEQVILSQELRIEYGKHPPLPTWILFGANRLFGASIGMTYVLGALCSVTTTLLLYVFSRPLIGARRAAFAAILLSNIEYMSTGTAYFNHNTVQLPLALLAIVLFHRALTRMRWVDWALFGAGCGVMLLAKFSAVVLFVSFAAYLLWARRLAELPIWKGLAISVLVSVTVISPYLFAVHDDPWSANAYAMNSVFPSDRDRIQGLKTVWGFASSQVSKVAPALLIFFILRRGSSRAPAPGPAEPGRTVALGPFLTVVGYGPLVLTVIIATLTGAHLLVGWGTTFHVLLTFWLVAVPPLGIDVQPRLLRRALFASVTIQVVLFALVTTHNGRLPNLNPTPHPVAPPTPAELTDIVRNTWAQYCTAPLRFVVTDEHIGAAMAVRYEGQPRVVDGTRSEFTKFFPDNVRNADGAVVVVRRAAGTTTAGSLQLPLGKFIADARWKTTVELSASDGQRYEYLLGILAPLKGEGCKH